MKKISLVLLFMCAATWMSFAGTDVPQAVKTKFASMFPAVKKVEWEKEGANYEAEFETNDIETSAVFDAAGNHLQTEVEIKVSELPASISAYVSREYKEHKIAEAAKITEANGTIKYEAEIKKGKDETDLIFDSNGSFLNKEVEPADEHDEKDKD